MSAEPANRLTHYICRTCGVQHAASAAPPPRCAICDDSRQYVGRDGQSWTTMEELRKGHRNRITSVEPGLTGIGTEPAFAIGQRALLVGAPGGNILWDCVSLLDEATVNAVKALGGAAAIAVSHPHFYAAVVAWAEALDATIYLHADDREWVMRPDGRIVYWEGESRAMGPGVTLVRCGGHFDGSAVLHWAAGAGGRGALLTGDTLQVVADRRYVSFMRSYPNLVPLPAAAVTRLIAAVAPYDFDRIYGGWWDRVVESDARAAVERSAARYIAAIEDR